MHKEIRPTIKEIIAKDFNTTAAKLVRTIRVANKLNLIEGALY